MRVNVRSHMIFRPGLIYISDIIVNLPTDEMIKNRCLGLINRYTTELLIEFYNAMPH